MVVLTAHPAKFDEAMLQAGVPPQRLPSVEALKQLPHKFNWLRDPKGATSRKQKLAAWAREIKGAVEQQAELAARAPRSKL